MSRCRVEVTEVRECGETAPCRFHGTPPPGMLGEWRQMCAIDGDWGGTEWGAIITYLLDVIEGRAV